MMGFYPDDATSPFYTFTTPIFDNVTLKLASKNLEIEVVRPTEKLDLLIRL